MTTQELINYYADLLIMQYAGQPKAYATVQTFVSGVIMGQLPNSVQNAFNLNGPPFAEGVQLDTLGKYAGVTRSGFDLKGNPVTLSDADFISLIRVAIFTNNAGSSLSDIQSLLNTYFPNQIFVYDNADMQLSYLISSAVGTQDLISLFVTENLLPRPMGVGLSSVVYLPILSLYGFQSYANVAPDYNSSTIYNIGNRVFSNGIVYGSLVNSNLNNPVTDTAFWEALIYPYNSYVTYPVYKPYTWLSYANAINIL